MSLLGQIQSELATLPVHMQAEVLDFVQFVKQRRGLPQTVPELASDSTASGDSPFFRALTDAGFVGCIETDAQLSTHYKSQLDFSAKVGG